MKKHRRGLRLAACLLALATCAVLLCSCLHPGKADSYTATMPVIVVGSDNYPPFNYMGTDGAPTGIDVELATEAFKRLGYRVKFVTIDWEKMKELGKRHHRLHLGQLLHGWPRGRIPLGRAVSVQPSGGGSAL